MRPELFHIGNIAVPGYGFMIGIGFILAWLVAERRAKRLGMNSEAIIDIAIIAAFTGFLGAKILYVIISFKEFLSNPLAVIGSSGFVVYGGIISGVLCCMFYTKIKKLPFLEYFDLVMPEIALAQGFGRLGCFLAGCCYGRETDGVFGVMFPEGSMAPSGVRLIPTQLISSAGDFINMAILLFVAARFGYTACMQKKKAGEHVKRHLCAGDIGSLYMIIYGIGRFLIEFLRNDYRGEIGIFSTSQFISLFIVLFGVGLMVFNHKFKSDSGMPKEQRENPEDETRVMGGDEK